MLLHSGTKTADRRLAVIRRSMMMGTTALVLGSLAVGEAQAQTAPPKNTAQVEEVVVTARKREEVLINVPVAVTAVTGATVERKGLQNAQDLISRVPSLFYSQNRSFSASKDNMFLVVRGVGANPALDPSVGVFIDGVYQPAVGFDASFLDVERVELLRGPQGALFGRSTEGGALNIVTRKPGSDVRAQGSVRVDGLPSMYATGSVSGPVVDGRLYLGLSVLGYGTDGYVFNRTTEQKQNPESGGSVRAAIRYTPSEQTEVNFTADLTLKRGGEIGGGIALSSGPKSYYVDQDIPSNFRSNQGGAALTIDHDFGSIRLTSITGARSVKFSSAEDFDETAGLTGNVQFIDTDEKLVSQEIRLQSNSAGPLSWIGGVYAYYQRDENHLHSLWPTYFGAGSFAEIVTTMRRTGYAGFASASYAAFDGRLDLTAGLRLSHEQIDATRFDHLVIPAFGLNILRQGPADTSANDVSPNVQAVWHLTHNFNAYANVAKGFKSGGFERYPTTGSFFLPLKPETAVNYEAGFKGNVFDRRLLFSADIYRIDIRNLHIPTLVQDPATGFLGTQIASAGKAHTEGFEFEGKAAVTSGLSLSAFGSYTKGYFDEFIDTTHHDRSGEPIPNIPRWIYGLGVDYTHPLGENLQFVSNVSFRHVDAYFSGIGTPADSVQTYPSYNIWDADIGFDYRNMSVGLFVKNLTNEYIITNQSFSFDRGDILRQVAPPRTIGIRLKATFG